MFWVVVLASISLVIGIGTGVTGLKSMRSQEPDQAEIRWQQDPASPWRYETLSMVVISLHSLGLICLTVFMLLSVAGSNVFTFYTKINLSFFLFALALFAIFFTTYVTGVMIAFHFTQQWIRPVSYGIRADGLLYGGSLVGWQSFSHYEVGPELGLISLYSSYSPSIRTWVLQPPAESFTGVLGIIQQSLPSLPPVQETESWQRSPVTLILGMACLVLVALLPALWGWMQGPAWLWVYDLVAFFVVYSLGMRWITLFDGRGQKTSVKSVEA